jgi:opacity protein-like surface antigen
MIRSTAILIAALSVAGATGAYAQETTPGPGTVEVTVIPGGATYFTGADRESKFGNYNLGGALTYNFNRIVGVEGEVVGSVGIAQDLQFGGLTSNRKSPNTAAYTGNVVLSLPTHSSFVPYVTGGVGGLTILKRATLDINNTDTFLTGNAGGGLKWYAPSGRWGLRADYRFIATQSKDDAPAFFGQDSRYGHRVYGAVIINAIR